MLSKPIFITMEREFKNEIITKILNFKGQVFEHTFNYAKEDDLRKPRMPSTDDGKFTGKELRGFFTGEPDDWIPALVHDQHLTEDRIAVATFEFPEGTPYKCRDIPRTMMGDSGDVEECFVVFDNPIAPVSTRKVSRKEVNDLVEEGEQYYEDNDWDGDDDDDE
jgi:hypothetical protein